ncbi:growth-regulating factor 6-like [Actinidia eriantha]|uniref:growth-regulating factor 6-like n=1 Tax=Actinidia eriantha TaxID=165200 RepID=UPI002589FC93|nr:growth-regulating factor 6-like [Actinidia eriantha]
MDLGMVGLDGLLSPSLSLDPEAKQNWYGSGFLKQERPKEEASEDDLRASKVSKTCDFSADYKAMPLLRSSGSLFSEDQQMLSFSSPSSSQAMTLPLYQHPSSAYGKNTALGGYGCGGGGGVKGPFTPSQWMELEHQALIYKYITANVPIPSNLLIPIRKALDSAGLYGFSGGPLGPTSLGWGAFRVGFSNSIDPQPGRCRRTDGKKWRCSRDAVADQKYCERHMNRGRHRSRKPVEGQTGHSVSGPTAPATTTAKLMPMASAASPSLVPSGNASNGLGLAHQSQFKNLQPSGTNPSPNRVFLNKENVGERIQESQFSIPKHHNPYGLDSSRAEFGLVCSDSLLNPLHKASSLIACKNYGSSHAPNTTETESNRSLRQFMDDWPNTNQADRAHLSISIPVAPTSSTSSPALSPLRLSRELESTQMGLGVGSVVNEPNQKEANWIPISWENSMGGPLGEVLHSTNSGCGDYKNSSALNLMTKGWDVSPRLASSPTGVLQKMTFGSLSNSSAGSSPRTESHRTHEGASFFNDLLGSTLAKSSSLPA